MKELRSQKWWWDDQETTAIPRNKDSPPEDRIIRSQNPKRLNKIGIAACYSGLREAKMLQRCVLESMYIGRNYRQRQDTEQRKEKILHFLIHPPPTFCLPYALPNKSATDSGNFSFLKSSKEEGMENHRLWVWGWGESVLCPNIQWFTSRREWSFSYLSYLFTRKQLLSGYPAMFLLSKTISCFIRWLKIQERINDL